MKRIGFALADILLECVGAILGVLIGMPIIIWERRKAIVVYIKGLLTYGLRRKGNR